MRWGAAPSCTLCDSVAIAPRACVLWMDGAPAFCCLPLPCHAGTLPPPRPAPPPLPSPPMPTGHSCTRPCRRWWRRRRRKSGTFRSGTRRLQTSGRSCGAPCRPCPRSEDAVPCAGVPPSGGRSRACPLRRASHGAPCPQLVPVLLALAGRWVRPCHLAMAPRLAPGRPCSRLLLPALPSCPAASAPFAASTAVDPPVTSPFPCRAATWRETRCRSWRCSDGSAMCSGGQVIAP